MLLHLVEDMKVVEKRKFSHKLEFKLLKIIPMLLAICQLVNIILSYFGYEYVIFSIIAGTSIIPLIFLYLSSYVFGFCEYHRMFLHYVVLNDVLAWIDYEYIIPITDKALLMIHLVITGIFLFIILYLKFKVCKKQ